jgi:hypothetical protein
VLLCPVCARELERERDTVDGIPTAEYAAEQQRLLEIVIVEEDAA